jgi:hypothetical protein
MYAVKLDLHELFDRIIIARRFDLLKDPYLPLIELLDDKNISSTDTKEGVLEGSIKLLFRYKDKNYDLSKPLEEDYFGELNDIDKNFIMKLYGYN